jgi:hypothetical protein
MLRILGVGLAFLLASIFLIVIVGYFLPVAHVASRSILLRQKPESVFALISNFKDEPSWRSDVREVEMLADEDGRTTFREKGMRGAMTMEVVESSPPRRQITRIVGKDLPFGGVWILDVLPAEGGCRLNITERGEVYNPVFRFVSRFMIGYDGTMDTYLRNVARKFGESAHPSEGEAAD